jgi:hypothetical protein
VSKVNLPLSDGRLRLFLEGKEDWLEEGLLVPAKEMKDYRRMIFYGPRRRCTKIMCHHLEGFRRCQVTTAVYQCKHGGVVQPCPHQILRCPT